MDTNGRKRQNQKTKRLIVAGCVLILFVVIISLLIILWLFPANTSLVPANTPPSDGYVFSQGIYSVEPREVNDYAADLEDSPYFSAVNHAALKNNSKDLHIKLSLDEIFMPMNWSENELIHLPISNPGFEKPSGGSPADWEMFGTAKYSDKNCFEGDKCLYVEADNSPTGYLILNSRPVDVQPFYNYTFSFHINCIKCDNNSAYMAVIWLRNKSYEGKPELITERGRHVLPLHNTAGYESFNISVQALPDSIKAVLAIRVHTEAASIQPITRLYIDG